jgi:hypothetical protein
LVKTVLGLLQFGCMLGGFIALFNGQWLAMVGAWVAAGLIGLAGNRVVRAAEGISETGREAVADVSRAIELLRRGEFGAATGVTRSAVTGFRMGGDKDLLPIAMTVHAVSLASIRDVSGAEQALTEASGMLRSLPPELAAELPDMRHMHALVQRELQNGVPDPSRLVAEFLALNDAP